MVKLVLILSSVIILFSEPERKRRPPIRKPSVSAQKELDANSADFQRPSRARQSKRIFSDSDENPVSFDGPGDSLESRDSTNSTEKKETEQSPVAEETHASMRYFYALQFQDYILLK